MKKALKQAVRALSEIAFPQVCICCNNEIHSSDRYLCDLCLLERFEPAGMEENLILPEGVQFMHAMWNFDKGGYLQQLLHKLKYDFLKGVGNELGWLLAQDLMQTDTAKTISDPVIVPVPLHPAKQRKRGYNQAEALAQGFARRTGWELIGEQDVTRVKKTTTQTGLNSSQRTDNLRNAFAVANSELFREKFVIIIDDVYTTGATTFELASALRDAGATGAGIVTVAKA